ncbi:MAG: alginate export family protein [Candidatus Omnitrophota bacterium]
MGKRLIMALAFVLAAGLTCSAYAEVQNVRVSGDINAWYQMRDLALTDAGKDQAFASIARVRVDADLTDNISATVRLLNERYWGNETELPARNGTDNITSTEVSIDLAFVTVKEFLYSPLTVTVGRQDLRFGNAMIIGDPDTNNQATTASAFGGATRDPDLSARKAFDAIRATLDYDPLRIDAIYSQVSEGTLTGHDDTTLYGINANYALDDKTTIEGYYFGKYIGRNNTAFVPNNKPDRVDVLGARIATMPIDNLTFQLEGAYQMGKRVNVASAINASRNAWAVETGAEYLFQDVKYTPSLAAGYAYFTGQKEDDTKHCRAWDPMYEDQKYGDIANALFDQSNIHVAVMSSSMKATEDITLMASGYGFWWDKKFNSNDVVTSRRNNTLVMKPRKYAGTELDLKAVYDYTEDVQFSLLSGILWPGGSFSNANDRTATEVIGSMKVIF